MKYCHDDCKQIARITVVRASQGKIRFENFDFDNSQTEFDYLRNSRLGPLNLQGSANLMDAFGCVHHFYGYENYHYIQVLYPGGLNGFFYGTDQVYRSWDDITLKSSISDDEHQLNKYYSLGLTIQQMVRGQLIWMGMIIISRIQRDNHLGKLRKNS